MTAHVARFSTLTRVIFAGLMILGILAGHSVATGHSAAAATSAVADSTPAMSVMAPTAVASCDSTGAPQCCTEPVACVESITIVHQLFGVTSEPAVTLSLAPSPVGSSVSATGGSPIPAPSLVALSISRT